MPLVRRSRELDLHIASDTVRKRFLTDVHALANKALSAGGVRVSPGEVHWDISSGCERPFRTECYARPSRAKDGAPWVVVKPGSQTPFMVVLVTPCHRCESCAARKSALWKRRIAAEYSWSARVWLGTLTVRPQDRFQALTVARARAGARGEDFDALSAPERARALHAIFGRELQLMLKRVRKAAAVPFRFLAVGELHEDGFPHYHVLIHEVRDDLAVRHAVLAKQWRLGFSSFKLVDDVYGATYVAKYLLKQEGNSWARVRASIAYGEAPYGVEVFKKHLVKNHDPRGAAPPAVAAD